MAQLVFHGPEQDTFTWKAAVPLLVVRSCESPGSVPRLCTRLRPPATLHELSQADDSVKKTIDGQINENKNSQRC